MRPLTLTIRGLHSFREEQTVDFEYLCEGGVFGIFGPTGSGKSTILDAMTLALYGKVERAPSNTQGILHHGENQLAVSLTFSLGSNTYKVERTYKRQKEDRLVGATARLVHVSDETIVLADKATDVTAHVQDLLGLSNDDFTRAVVLPQGKFAEFLSLKGTERRLMLQRLFHLEKYGDELNRKLRSKLSHEKSQIELIEREQQGLGEISEELMKEKQQELHLAVANRDKTQEQLAKQEGQVSNVQKKRTLSVELENLQEEQRVQIEKEQDMLVLKKELDTSKEANQYKDLVAALLKETAALSDMVQTEAKMKEVSKRHREEYKQAAEAFKRAEIEKEQEVPLKVLLAKLVEVEQIEKELVAKKRKLTDVEQEKKHSESHARELSEQLEKKKKDEEKYRQAQNSFKEKIADLRNAVTNRKEIEAAYEASLPISMQEKQVNQLRRDIPTAVTTTGEKVKQAETVLEEKKLESRNISAKLQYWYDGVKMMKRQLDDVMETYKAEKKEHELLHAVALVQSNLVEGEACPVCGSHEHHIRQEKDHFRSDERLDQDYSSELSQLTELSWSLEQLSNSLPYHSEEADSYAHNEIHYGSDTFKEDWASFIASLEAKLTTVRGVLEKGQAFVRSYTEFINEHKQLETAYDYEQKELLQKKTEAKEKEVEWEKMLAEWKSTYPAFSVESIGEERDRLREKQEQVDFLQARLDKSHQAIDDVAKEKTAITEELQQANRRQLEAEQAVKELDGAIKSAEENIYSVTSGKDLSAYKEETQQSLSQLERAFKQAYERSEMAKKALQETTSKLATIDARRQDIEERLSELKEKWEVAETSLSIEDVQRHAKEAQDIRELEATLRAFDEQVNQVKGRIQSLLDELEGGPVTEEELKLEVEKQKDLRDQAGEERERVGAITEVIKQMEARLERYRELEGQKGTHGELVEKLSKLDKVFRGKEFVEFIAEEQLHTISQIATDRLKQLTRGRYALEVDSSGGFIMRDDVNGGVKRSVTTLSGGETFLTSLALALALSTSIQLNGQHALEFFFLDEGFGTLDPDLLETVIHALEKLHTDRLSVGVISHVPELRERLPRKLIVTPGEASGRGTTVKLEEM
ncbi:SMC family ATPase [Paenalkalicoccus suaedae]|uniref:Nuclease SbcCD subunit C n=1 Tax=Paenalkalicoccus suaedae TaxID=2592382 RepID=A0A859FCW7_9BACI|nr:SMC family ATPase [Paenalkalicoccus suaedae]QKS71193.1 SMC family ATPase [Paenalkalicoccus suaedae]